LRIKAQDRKEWWAILWEGKAELKGLWSQRRRRDCLNMIELECRTWKRKLKAVRIYAASWLPSFPH
jgi:hypothetical protein